MSSYKEKYWKHRLTPYPVYAIQLPYACWYMCIDCRGVWVAGQELNKAMKEPCKKEVTQL